MRKILVLAILFLYSCSGQDVMAIHPMMTYGPPVQPSATPAAAPTANPVYTEIASTLPVPTSSLTVVITAQTVNIRDANLHATGNWLSDGNVLAVHPSQDGWYRIVAGQYTGDLIWAGCTSVSENRTCESK